MLVAARDAGVRRFVYAASSSTYGDHPALPKVEDAIGRPLSPYAVTKLVNELYADVFARCYGVQSIGLRYFNIFGARQDPDGAYAAVIPRWIHALLAGEEVAINGDGETSRDFCYVDNAVQANLLAAVTDDPAAINQVYNVAVDDRTSLNRLFQLLRDAIAARSRGRRGSPVHRDFRPGDVRHSQADIGKARRLLGYAPTHRLVDGIHAAMPWYLAASAPRRSARTGLPPARRDGPSDDGVACELGSRGDRTGSARWLPSRCCALQRDPPMRISMETPSRLIATLRAEARAYEHGEGVPRDPARAVELYCEAARLGDAEAQFSLGWMYANGRGMPRDNRMASLFFGMAAAQGHEYAQKMLALRRALRRRPARMHARSRRRRRSRRRSRPPRSKTCSSRRRPSRRRRRSSCASSRPSTGSARCFALAIIRAESNFDPNAISARNAQGLMQLIPETSARFNVRKPFDPAQNVRGGLAYLRWLLAYFRGDVALVAAAYNAGEGTVERYRGIPPYAETRAYVQRIKRWFRKDSHPYDATVVDPSPELARIRAVNAR